MHDIARITIRGRSFSELNHRLTTEIDAIQATIPAKDKNAVMGKRYFILKTDSWRVNGPECELTMTCRFKSYWPGH